MSAPLHHGHSGSGPKTDALRLARNPSLLRDLETEVRRLRVALAEVEAVLPPGEAGAHRIILEALCGRGTNAGEVERQRGEMWTQFAPDTPMPPKRKRP